MSKGFEVYIESGRKALKELDNYRETAEQIKRIVGGFWSNNKVYVFGSVLEGKYTAMSDIDVLIVVDGVSEEEALRVRCVIYKTIDAPVQLHVVSTYEFQNWYRRFIDKLEEVN